MQMYEVFYTVYKGRSNEILTEGRQIVPTSNGRWGAENAIKAMFNDGVNTVFIRTAHPAN